ncbi:MAG TPA: hypothetical protein VM513_09840 [Kofleriaceae bacterium]|jgi:hypothetical protein|nr:hypothetical protein [Kofleriaceae bacterium]
MRKHVGLSWSKTDDREINHIVDGLLYGRYGVSAYLRRAEHLIHVARRLDLAERALRRAAGRYAAVRALGFRHRPYESRITDSASSLKLEVRA